MDLVEVNFDIQNRHPWEMARLKVVKSLLQKHHKNITSILDVGSGDAFVANELSKHFNNAKTCCVDIEYTEAIKNVIQEKFNNNNLHLFNDASNINEKQIDVLTFLDVIEHVQDDVALINSVKSIKGVNNNTYCLITVPAFQNLFSKHDVALKHYRRYTIKKLKKTLEECDLEIVETGYFFLSLIPPRILQLCKEKLIKTEVKDLENLGSWNKGKLVTNTITGVLYADYKIGRLISKLGIKIPGLSCYAVCKIK